MDEKKYLLKQISGCRHKLNMAKLLDAVVFFAAASGLAGIVCELVSIFVPFYYVHLAAVLCFAAGVLAGLVYTAWHRADMKAAARRLDSFGLKERMLTAYELLDREDEFARLQRADALSNYRGVQEQIKVPLLPDWRRLLAFLVSAALVAGLGFVPSAARDEARVRHEVQKQAKEEKEKAEKLLDALESVDMDSLSADEQEQLKELMEALERSKEELAAANSWTGLNSAMERLEYKYEQAGQNLEKLAGLLEDPKGAGVANAEAIAKALANQGGEQFASGGTPGAGSGDGKSDSGTESGDGNSGDGNGSNGDGNGSDGNGNGNGNGGDGEGNGNGSGNGNGNGNGSGSGSGNGSGGSGSGRGTGSSNAAHDYVSIPNAVADDASLTGDKNGDQDSDYYRQQNGLSWEGEHVDYNSVVGDYALDAYEGIASGKYPSGMEHVIKDYFENLSQ